MLVLGEPGRLDTSMYVVTTNACRLCVYLYYICVVVPIGSVDTPIMFMYVYCTVVLVPGEPLRTYRRNLN